ncbi:MAG: DUF938 domain-containing protein [Myxococcales bacterium]|nr:DUF938 domain-containing protein [Myxococcales bacterium]
MKRHAPATERNQQPIAQALQSHLPAKGLLVEIASGTGQHTIYFARKWPDHTFQPTDIDSEAIASIEAWRMEAGLTNILPAQTLNAAEPDTWPDLCPDTIFCANMIHISPWKATEGLFAGAAQRLATGGKLVTYGPYLINGQPTTSSNASFDVSLSTRNPEWGLRDVADLDRLGQSLRLTRIEKLAMPANNFLLVYQR